MANATRVTAARDQARPRKLGRYELEECLGIDAGIETFRARVRGLAGFDRIFAVKCHRRGRGVSINLNDPYIRIAKRTAALNDARIARVLDADVIDGVAVVVTEFVHGLDLDRMRDWGQSSGVLATGTDEPAQKWQKIVGYIGAEAAGGLAFLHALSPALVHGGLSPRNIIATARGGIKLLDVGLRRAALPPEDGNPPRAFSYAQIDDWAADPSAAGDVRALGAILFELATGEPPPVGMGRLAVRQVLEALWPGMADILAAMLAEEPDARPSSADVARVFGEFWADVPDASMIAEVAALVRNFSAFVTDGAPPLTPSPVSVEAPLPKPAEVAGTRPLTFERHESPEATAVVPVPMVPAEAKAISPAGSFAAVPDGPTRMAADSAYVKALFAALPADAPTPAFAALPDGLHAPVEAMAKEIEAADLETTVSLDGLPPPPASEEPEAIASELLVPDDGEAVRPALIATSIDPVPVPEAEMWGAQALAALGSQAGVDVSAAWSSATAAASTDAPSLDGAETGALLPPVREPAIEEAFAFQSPAVSVAAPMETEIATRPMTVTRTLLFSASHNLEDELVDERAEAEQDAVQATDVPALADVAVFEKGADELAVPASEPHSRSAASFESPEPPSLALVRDTDDLAHQARAEDDPIFAATSPIVAPEVAADEGEAEWSPPRLAHAMTASDERLRKPVTRTARRSAEDLQAFDDAAEPSSSRIRRIGFVIALVAILLGAASAAAVKLGLPWAKTRTQTARPEIVKRTATATRQTSSAGAKSVLPIKAADADKKSPSAAPVVARRSAAASTPIPSASEPTRARDGMASLSIASRPEGAAVWIDGEERCKTPCSVRVKPGNARLVLIRSGHSTSQSTIAVSDGARVDLALDPIDPPSSGDARFRVECSTKGKLPIVVDGRETGMLCPYSKMRVEPGSHSIGLYIPATGKSHSKDITLSVGVRSIIFAD